jgi:hypothetical protein
LARVRNSYSILWVLNNVALYIYIITNCNSLTRAILHPRCRITCAILHPRCRITFYTLLLPPCPTEPSAPANCPPRAPGPANRPSHSHLPLPNPTGSYSDSHTRSPFGPRAMRHFARAAAATREGGGGAGLRRRPWGGRGCSQAVRALQLVPILVPPIRAAMIHDGGGGGEGRRRRGSPAASAGGVPSSCARSLHPFLLRASAGF